MQQDLKTMKISLCRKRSMEGSNLDSKENNCSSKKPKSSSDVTKKVSSSFLSHEVSSLSVALMASRTAVGRKRKTTFLSSFGKQKKTTTFSRSQSSSSSSSKSVSLNHVVFMAGDNSQSATSQLELSNSKSFLGSAKPHGHRPKTRNSRGRSSLWDNVCSKNFRAKK